MENHFQHHSLVRLLELTGVSTVSCPAISINCAILDDLIALTPELKMEQILFFSSLRPTLQYKFMQWHPQAQSPGRRIYEP